MTKKNKEEILAELNGILETNPEYTEPVFGCVVVHGDGTSDSLQWDLAFLFQTIMVPAALGQQSLIGALIETASCRAVMTTDHAILEKLNGVEVMTFMGHVCASMVSYILSNDELIDLMAEHFNLSALGVIGYVEKLREELAQAGYRSSHG